MERMEKLLKRRIDSKTPVKGINEVYQRIAEEPAIKYAIGAMQPIDAEYTRNTYKESERVQNQLSGPLQNQSIYIVYDHQGSVTNNTHIKAHSDIDLLLIEQSSFCVEPPNKPITPYTGDPFEDLKKLRTESVGILRGKFPEVKIDTSGACSVALSGGSLARKIDLVYCNWWNTCDFVATGLVHTRGIQVLNLEKNTRIGNKPFLHNEEIDRKDKEVAGNVRKLIRLIKSLVYDSESKTALSSYDIASVIHSMPNDRLLPYGIGKELQLMLQCSEYFRQLIDDEAMRTVLLVPNKMRKIFGAEGASLTQLKETKRLLDELLLEIQQGLSKSFRKLSEARIAY